MTSLDSTELKHDLAAQPARGARGRLRLDYGIGATGVAGPGGQGGRPVGEAFVAVAARSDVVDILDAASGHDKPATTRS